MKFNRTILFILLVLAGVTFMTYDYVHHIQASKTPSFIQMTDIKQREVNVEEKKLATMEPVQTISEAPAQLDDVIDTSKYPSVKVVATGYTSGPESTGKTADHPEYGITFSGIGVTRDIYSTIAADLDVFPLGTIMYIPDYGYGVVTDKGGAIKGNKIDLYFHTVEDVFSQWGKKELDIYVIEEGKGEVTEADLTRLNETESLQVFRDAFK